VEVEFCRELQAEISSPSAPTAQENDERADERMEIPHSERLSPA
jgi:hypothetical protein